MAISRDNQSPGTATSGRGIILWHGVMLGVVGLVCGYWGPLHYYPSANQGPLMGIFVTGPAATVVGILFGWAAVRIKLTPAVRESVFLLIAVGVGVATLSLSQPGKRLAGSIVVGQIGKCENPSVYMTGAVGAWKKRITDNPRLVVRPGWESEIPALLARTPGVIVEFRAARQRSIFQSPAPNAGGLRADDWVAVPWSGHYFVDYAGSECSAYKNGANQALWIGLWHGEDIVPPNSIPGLLDMQILEKVPPEVESFSR